MVASGEALGLSLSTVLICVPDEADSGEPRQKICNSTLKEKLKHFKFREDVRNRNINENIRGYCEPAMLLGTLEALLILSSKPLYETGVERGPACGWSLP